MHPAYQQSWDTQFDCCPLLCELPRPSPESHMTWYAPRRRTGTIPGGGGWEGGVNNRVQTKDILPHPLQHTTLLVHPRVVLAAVAGQAVIFPQLSYCNHIMRPSHENDHRWEPMTTCCQGHCSRCPLCVLGGLADVLYCLLALLCKYFRAIIVIGKPKRVLVHVYDPLLVVVWTTEERCCSHELRCLDVRLLRRSRHLIRPQEVDK